MVPEKSVFFCSTMAQASRRCSFVYSRTGRPPTDTVPFVASYRRGISDTSDVFPLPVPPRMPTVCPLWMCRSMSSNVHSGLLGAYLKETWSKSTLPLCTTAACCAPVSSVSCRTASSVMSGSSSSTSIMRRAQATERVIIIKIMDTISSEIRICVT